VLTESVEVDIFILDILKSIPMMAKPVSSSIWTEGSNGFGKNSDTRSLMVFGNPLVSTFGKRKDLAPDIIKQ